MQALSDRDQPTTSLAIAHLKSYQRMGQAGVVCLEGCTCEGIEFDGHQGEQNSQTHISMVEVSAAGVCTCRAAVADSVPTALRFVGTAYLLPAQLLQAPAADAMRGRNCNWCADKTTQRAPCCAPLSTPSPPHPALPMCPPQRPAASVSLC